VAPIAETWSREYSLALAEMIGRRGPSLAQVARRLTMSSRTLQRLGEHGTCWRAELEAARRAIASDSSGVKMASLARQRLRRPAIAAPRRAALEQRGGRPARGGEVAVRPESCRPGRHRR
jgi:transposase-like protein